jgi:AraC-like DNA-binding protein
MKRASALTTLGDAAARGEALRFWREPRYDDLECLSATFRTYRYVPHTHETYAIAAVIEGCEAFFHRGARHYAAVGSIAVVPPDELHDGEPAGDSFAYRTLYPSVELMRAIAEDVFGRPVSGTPSFAQSVIDDPDLSGRLATLHGVLARPETPVLERDSLVAEFFELLLSRWGGDLKPRQSADVPAAIARARDYLEAHFDREVSLEELAGIAGLNRAHLIRAFRKAVGLTPHAYQLDRRVRAACHRLAAGEAPADVAAACGFCDQSHLNRVFKARIAVTPGQFRGRPL